MRVYGERDQCYNTFTLIWCEQCCRGEEPPRRLRMPDIASDELLHCTYCGDLLTMLECFISPKAVHYQERLGMPHRYVASLAGLQQ